MCDWPVLQRLAALKDELEKLGCKVTFVNAKLLDEPLIVHILYPSDVPPDEGHEEEIVDHGR